jgi:tetratricopeptide (TPR) repeat protein
MVPVIGGLYGEADTLVKIGTVSRRQGYYQKAAETALEGLKVYRHIGGRIGQADALNDLWATFSAQVSMKKLTKHCARSDHDNARARYEHALSLYERIGDVLGHAHAIKSLGDIDLRRSDYDSAQARYRLLTA